MTTDEATIILDGWISFKGRDQVDRFNSFCRTVHSLPATLPGGIDLVETACFALSRADESAGQPNTAEGWRRLRASLSLRTRAQYKAGLIQ